jgi:hypothetical protein
LECHLNNETLEINLEGLASDLEKYGLNKNVFNYWYSKIGKIKNINGKWYKWIGAIGDKAFLLIKIANEPMTIDELKKAILENHEDKTVRDALMRDGRFQKTDRTHFALAEWSMAGYSTTVEAIRDEIEGQKGLACIETLINNVVKKYDLNDHTARAYLNAPMFVCNNGLVKLRDFENDAFFVKDIKETKDCYVLSDSILNWKIKVNSELLRGSGKTMPAEIAHWLGINPRDEKLFASDLINVKVTWPESAPAGATLGSIRGILNENNIKSDDNILVSFSRHDSRIAIKKIDLKNAAIMDWKSAVRYLIGMDQDLSQNQLLELLSGMLGVVNNIGVIKIKLANRGDNDLSDLLPDKIENKPRPLITLASGKTTLKL